ncbi:hypothetical protein ACFY7Y_01330 [Streptomyces virginiae]|uniref:hypothetical protein n=1 Tax=Streptomyces virginiae TaxID=1961 RepID=UPI00368A966E
MHAFHGTPLVRTSRPHPLRRFAGVAAASLFVLSLTACQDGTGLKDGGEASA